MLKTNYQYHIFLFPPDGADLYLIVGNNFKDFQTSPKKVFVFVEKYCRIWNMKKSCLFSFLKLNYIFQNHIMNIELGATGLGRAWVIKSKNTRREWYLKGVPLKHQHNWGGKSAAAGKKSPILQLLAYIFGLGFSANQQASYCWIDIWMCAPLSQ